MTEQKKCCEKCEGAKGEYGKEYFVCRNHSCPCHTNHTAERECSGCTDLRDDPMGGTHAMHTKQHPCPEGGDPNCGYCFPVKTNHTAGWEELFDGQNFLLFDKASGSRYLDEDKLKSFICQEIATAREEGRNEAVEYIRNNYSPYLGELGTGEDFDKVLAEARASAEKGDNEQ